MPSLAQGHLVDYRHSIGGWDAFQARRALVLAGPLIGVALLVLGPWLVLSTGFALYFVIPLVDLILMPIYVLTAVDAYRLITWLLGAREHRERCHVAERETSGRDRI